MTRRGKHAGLNSGWKKRALWLAGLTVALAWAGHLMSPETTDGFRYSRAEGLQDFAQHDKPAEPSVARAGGRDS